MQSGNNLDNSPIVEAITEALVRTVVDSLPLFATAITESFARQPIPETRQPVTPVQAGQPRTYLVEATLTDSALKVFLATSGVDPITPEALTRAQQSPLFAGVDLIGALTELRTWGLVYRSQRDGRAIYIPTNIADDVFNDMSEDGFSQEFQRYVGLIGRM